MKLYNKIIFALIFTLMFCHVKSQWDYSDLSFSIDYNTKRYAFFKEDSNAYFQILTMTNSTKDDHILFEKDSVVFRKKVKENFMDSVLEMNLFSLKKQYTGTNPNTFDGFQVTLSIKLDNKRHTTHLKNYYHPKVFFYYRSH